MNEKFQIEATEVSSRIQQAIEAVARMKTENIQDTIVWRTLTETTMILQDARRVFESMTVRVPDSE
jgi:hypothetical protein